MQQRITSVNRPKLQFQFWRGHSKSLQFRCTNKSLQSKQQMGAANTPSCPPWCHHCIGGLCILQFINNHNKYPSNCKLQRCQWSKFVKKSESNFLNSAKYPENWLVVCVCGCLSRHSKRGPESIFLHSKWEHFDKARSKFQSSLCD